MRYAETDQMGVVYYANYLVWMEVARGDLCKACGFNYVDMEQDDGILMAVAEANCRYRSPARFDEEVIVKAWIAEANTRMVTIEYEMRLGERRARYRVHAAHLRIEGYAASQTAGEILAVVRDGRKGQKLEVRIRTGQ